MNANFKVGDIVSGSWCYGGCTPFFYEITKISGSRAHLKRRSKKVTSHDGYGQNGMCVCGNDYEEGFLSDVVGTIKDDTITNKKHRLYLYPWNGEEKSFFTD